tara:strand:- start:1283 stop:1834 length:552 start_codon:yes stop_codon:yes gene_type:complete
MIAIEAARAVDLRALAGVKAGSKALCPFHDDHHPSLSVYRGRDGCDRFKCFACGAAGDAIDFVRRTENLTFRKAIERLAGTAPPPASLRRQKAAGSSAARLRADIGRELSVTLRAHNAIRERAAFWADVLSTAHELAPNGPLELEAEGWLGQLYDAECLLDYRSCILAEGTDDERRELLGVAS